MAVAALMHRRHFLAGAVALQLADVQAQGQGRTQPQTALPSRADPREVASSSHFPFGPVVPARKLDGWPVTTHRGRTATLGELLAGKVSALQLMFTGCSASCPIQGALFAQAQQGLGSAVAGVQLVSISIDTLGDTPQRLDTWLRGFSTAPNWWAAVPRPDDVDKLIDRLGKGGERRPAGPDPHNGQVYLFNRRAELVLRTPSMPPAEKIVDAIRAVVAQSA